MSRSDLTGLGPVLVVGDSPPIEAIASRLAAATASARVIRATAISEILEEPAATPTCVVCEYRSDDATDPVEAVANRFPDVPILAVSGTETAPEAIAAGATDVLAPDATAAVIAARVGSLVARRDPGERTARDQSLLASADAIVGILSADGQIRAVSPPVESALGHTPTELAGRTLASLVHPADEERAAALRERVASGSLGDRRSDRVRVRRADGSWQVTRLTVANRLEDPAVQGLVLTLTTAVEPSLEPADAGLDRLTDAVIVLGPAWELQYWNAAAQTLFERQPAAGSVVWPFLPDRLAESLMDGVREAVGTDSVSRFDAAASPAGTDYRVTVSPGETGVTILVQPVEASAERPAIGDADRLALLEGAIDSLVDGLVVLEDDEVVYANATMVTWAGGEMVVGEPIERVFDPQLAATIRDRTGSPVVHWLEPVDGQLVVGAEPRPVAVSVSPIPGGDRTACLVRDATASPHWLLERVATAVGELRAAESDRAIRETTVGAVRDCTQAIFVGWYEATETGVRPVAAVGPSDESIEPPPIDPSGTPLPDLADATQPIVSDEPVLVPVLSRAGLAADRVTAIGIPDGGVVLAASTDPVPGGTAESAALETLAATAASRRGRLQERADLGACRQRAAELSAALTMADVLRDHVRAILTADTRQALERRLLDGVTSMPAPVVGGWVARTDASSPGLVASEGAGCPVPDESLPIDAGGTDPTSVAAATRESTQLTDLERAATPAEPILGQWLERLRADGVRSAVAVPIDYEGLQYGVLTVYGTEPGAFDDRQRAVVEHLAAVAGVAIASSQCQRALVADRATELEVVLRDDEPLSAAARALGHHLVVRSVGRRSETGSTIYCTTEGRPDVDLSGLTEAVAGLEDATLLGEDACNRLELQFAAPTVADRVAAHGGVLRSVTPVDDRSRLVVALPPRLSVRSVVAMLERFYPGTELVARREVDRDSTSPDAFEASLAEHLSERQRRTLETAYYAGFFEWPRERTGEEVAASLGISQPTFSRHLRTAQRTLFEALFEDE